MAKNKSSGQLERSLAALTIGMQQSIDRRIQAGLSEKAGEVFQQVQVPLAGAAALAAAYIDKKVTWRLPFVYAPQQRLASFPTPHFSTGIEFTSTPGDLVRIDAGLMAWNKDARNWLVGATIRFVVQAPNAGALDTVDFEAIAHLTFQGYAAQPESTGL
jgi:hypothetical protein